KVELDGEDVSEEIRHAPATEGSSVVAVHLKIRSRV
ncbi:unnamed protein product, partial [marine sediment metagenome]